MFPTFGMMIGRGKCNMKLPKPQWKICISISKLLELFDGKNKYLITVELPNWHLCHFLLPGQNYFCPGQNQKCPRQNQNCPGQNIFCPRQKKFVPG